MPGSDIGYYTLPVILSFKGIDKQVEDALGDTLKSAAKKAGDDFAKGVTEGAKTGGKAAADSISKPVTKSAEKVGADAGKKLDESLTKATKDTGTKVGKAINESVVKSTTGSGGFAKTAKDAAGEFGKGFIEGVTQGVSSGGGRGLGDNIVDSVSDSVKSAVRKSKVGTAVGGEFTDGLINGISDALQDSDIGQAITSTLNDIGGDVAAKVTPIIGALDPLRNSLEAFKTRDVAGGLQAAVGVLQSLESLGVPPGIASGLQDIANRAEGVKETADNITTLAGAAQDLGGKNFGKGTKFGDSLDALAASAGPIGLTVAAADLLDQQFTKLGIAKFTEVPGSALWFLHQLNSDWSGIKELTDALGRLGNMLGGPFSSAPTTAQAQLDAARAAAAAAQSVTPGYVPAVPGETRRPTGGGRAGGGPISGPGSGISDSILAWVSNGEYVVNADATRKNMPLLEIINSGALPGFAGGGVVGPDVRAAQDLVGTPYSQATRFDCSGTVARVILATLGQGGGLMSTKTAAAWLTAHGFVKGRGGPGQISVGWYDHGPNPNDGHMAMTLSDGRPAEAGGSHGAFLVGPGATGADGPQFDQHMFLPTVYGEGPAGSSAAPPPVVGGSAAGAVTGVSTPASGGSSPGGGGNISISIPSSLSGFGTFAGEQLGKQLGDENLGKLTAAAGSFIDGQVSSVLDVFGVPSSPGWLKGISTLIGGISIGTSGGSASPLSATPTATGTTPPDDAGNMHGGRAGQQPGPTYNITARDTEDAFIRAQRQERERAAAKLSRY